MTRGRGWWPGIALPVGIFLAAEAVMLVVALAAGEPSLSPATWGKWDANYYLSIVDGGYSLTPCSGPDGPVGKTCGNAAWFPGIAWLTELPVALGAAAPKAMLVLARLLALGTLLVVWAGLLDRRRDGRAVAALVFVAFAPGAVYFHALFPMSLATCAIAGTLALVRHRAYGWAAVCGAVAATSYPIVVLIAPVLAVWVLLERGAPVGVRVRRAVLLAGGPVLGAIAVVLVMWAQSGALDAFRQVQSHYEYTPGLPVIALRDQLSTLNDGRFFMGTVTALQELYVLGVMGVVVLWALVRRPRGMELLALVLGLVLWLVPLTLHQASLYRADTLLFVLALVVVRLPRPVAYAVAAGAVVLAPALATYYVRGTLV